jgi:hypothetical protein
MKASKNDAVCKMNAERYNERKERLCFVVSYVLNKQLSWSGTASS